MLGAKSLHEFLGRNFGQRTRMFAGACSILGFTLLVGWEFTVGKATFEGLLKSPTQPSYLVLAFMIGVVFATFLYTAIGGLRSNAFANAAQNAIKLIVFVGMIILLGTRIGALPFAAFFPPVSVLISNIGFWGLITNVAFSLVWQFVDMSTWQSVIASASKLTESEAKAALKVAGAAVFLAPGVVGTVLGVLLTGTPGVDADNALVQLVGALPQQAPWILFIASTALLASMMSMIDGVLLAAAYSLVCDVLHRQESLEQIDKDVPRAERLVGTVRVFLGFVAVVGTLGVVGLMRWLDLSLFHVVYALIICQLALTGPVLTALSRKEVTVLGDRMVFAIVGGLATGAGALAIGKGLHVEWALTGAGFFTMVASYLAAKIIVAQAGGDHA